MPTLTVIVNGRERRLRFEGRPLLAAVLADNDVAVQKPCGGHGACGKCAAVISGAISLPSPEEERAGSRLMCQTRLLGDARAELPEERTVMRFETGEADDLPALLPYPGRYGAAVDIGTTTVALRLVELASGRVLPGVAMSNPQTAVAADVMGRIDAAMNGQARTLRDMMLSTLDTLLNEGRRLAAAERADVSQWLITGNTTMLYLLTGRDPSPLSRVPFRADCLFGFDDTLLGIPAYYPPCMHAFVGADITCAVLASGMCEQPDTALLCDVGTNGELALWKGGRLYVASTAAGPAFEGAGISCGCGSVRGAIDRVWLSHGGVAYSTIGDAPAAGLCGSGLIDAVAAYLAIGEISETGAMRADELALCGEVRLLPRDVRALQLAKAAIAAGLQTLLYMADVPVAEVKRLYIAGGFGSHMNLRSAAAIGLFPRALIPRARVIGNGAMNGAMRMLLNRGLIRPSDRLAAQAEHVILGGNPLFNEQYVNAMLFENSL